MIRRLLLVGLTVFLLSSCAPAPDPPNILFIYVDDMGWKDLGVQGSNYYETPHIDALAGQGMRFTQAYANAPNCAPSRAALLSGMYAPRTGVYTVGSSERGPAALRRLVPVENSTALPTQVVTLAEALQPAGYVSAHFGKWHLGGVGHAPGDQGFGYAMGGDASGSPPSYFYPYARGGRALPDLGEGGQEGEYLADRLTDEAIRFLEENRGAPFFLYLSHYSVHTPHEAKAEAVERFAAKEGAGGHDDPTYAAMIQSVDEGVGRLMDALDRLGLAENTVVFFTSDNGGFGPVTSMAPLRGSKGMLYEGGIREPLIVRWPGNIPAGSVSGEPVIGTDFYPTILDLAGAAPPVDQPQDGVSLVHLLLGGSEMEARPLFWHFPAYLEADRTTEGPWRTTPASAIRVGREKLIYFFEDARAELYDLEADVSEAHDLAGIHPERAAELLRSLESWWEATGAFVPTEPNPDFDEPGEAGGRAPQR